MTEQALPRQRHSWLEDVQSIVVGTLLIAFGMSLYADAHLVTGGGAGLGLLRSIAGAAVINLIMIFNFKKYRYNGFS